MKKYDEAYASTPDLFGAKPEPIVAQYLDRVDASLLIGLIPLVPRRGLAVLVERIEGWAAPGSLVFVTAFTTEDPQLEQCVRDWKRVGHNSFENEEGEVRTFLDPGEILDLFSGCRAIHHREYVGPEHRHGEGPLHRHAMTEVVLQS